MINAEIYKMADIGALECTGGVDNGSDNGSRPHESENLVEDFLLALLRAIEKLPINLNTLQACNIGKSVNNLRSYKNLEIQKKARGLVDTWKKRVDAELRCQNFDGRSDGLAGLGQPVSLSSKQVIQMTRIN